MPEKGGFFRKKLGVIEYFELLIVAIYNKPEF